MTDWLLANLWWIAPSIVTCLAGAAGAAIAGLRKRAESDVNSYFGFLAGALLYHPMRLLRGRTSIYLAFHYAKLQLASSATKYLQIPARETLN